MGGVEDPDYAPRMLDSLLGELLSELPAVMVTGPRATGKTTTAARFAASVVRLDRPAESALFRADPDAGLAAYDEPLLLDEWQEAPEVLGAVKRAVDADARPGRFLLTGSVRADLANATWPGTGRVVRVSMYGMTVRERERRLGTPTFVDLVASGQVPALPPDRPDVTDYVRLALLGGFPETMLQLGPTNHARWMDGYVDQLLTRDAEGVEPRRDPARLRRYFEAYASCTAGIVEDTTLLEAAGIDRKTAAAYERLLGNLYVIDAVPAWTSNRLKRLARRSKRYLVEPALLAPILRLDDEGIFRNGDLLGRLLDTFVAAQIRAELASSSRRARLYHLREEHGRQEIDLVAELGGERLIGIEVKASAAPARHDARHLVWLRERIGDQFIAGVLFHTGPAIFELDERVLAMPICALWG